MQLNLIERPSEEIVTLGEAKNYLRVDHDFDDMLIGGLIKSTREAIESILQKSILKQTWEYRLDNYAIDSLCFVAGDHPSICRGVMKIPLPKPPILKIIGVEVDNLDVDSDQYSLEREGGKFYLCIRKASLFKNKRKISLATRYEAGMADDVENIPYQLKLANLMLVANAFQERFSYEQKEIISQGVKQLLSPFLNLRII
ncbi:MAG: head-tail connector protein [Holosporaceae bacterium]|jgi:uncharacterized phiE125 gp8 family phage protein|nr:head-tail connector protein [Holosporaceae bacterium]